MDGHANFAISTVATAPSPAASGTSLVVAAGEGALFPTVPFQATIWPESTQPLASNAEIVRVTAISTDTFAITRTQEGTSARTIVVGDQIAATITKKTITDLEDEVDPANSPTYAGLTVSGLTASRLVATDGAKALASVANLTSWIAGTANQLTVTSDGDGSVTLSLPQNIHTTATPRFAQLGLGVAASATAAIRLYLSGSGNRIRLEDTATGIASLSAAMSGFEMTIGGMNTSLQYTPAIKFGSTDGQFTTENPKFMAMIIGRATQSYIADTNSGMAIDFATCPNDQGANAVPVVRMTIAEWPLASQTTTATAAGTRAVLQATNTVFPTANSASTHASFWNTVQSSASCTVNLTASEPLIGSFYEAYHRGSGTAVSLIGQKITVASATGAGAITQVVALKTNMAVVAGTTGTSVFGVQHNVLLSGTTTNHYAYWTSGTTTATNDWGLYIQNTKNYLSGLVGVGADAESGLQLLAVASASTVIPLVVRGASSQTGSLTEWRNSSNTALTTIDKDGKLSVFAGFVDGVNIVVGSSSGTKIGTATTQKLAFWNSAPVTQPATNAYTSDSEGSAYSGIDNAQGGTVYAQLTDLNALRVAYETLRASYDDLLTKIKTTGLVA